MLRGVNPINNQVYEAFDENTHGGFANVYCYGFSGRLNFMTMEFLGPNLADLCSFCGN